VQGYAAEVVCNRRRGRARGSRRRFRVSVRVTSLDFVAARLADVYAAQLRANINLWIVGPGEPTGILAQSCNLSNGVDHKMTYVYFPVRKTNRADQEAGYDRFEFMRLGEDRMVEFGGCNVLS